MSFTEDFLDGMATYLSAPGSPFLYRPTAPYADGEYGIFIMTAPLVKNRPLTLVLRTYYFDDDPSLSDSALSVQLDFYGPARAVLQGTDYAFDRLQGMWGGTLGGIKVQSATRTSVAVMGQDEGGNLRQTENYELAVYRPSPNRQ